MDNTLAFALIIIWVILVIIALIIYQNKNINEIIYQNKVWNWFIDDYKKMKLNYSYCYKDNYVFHFSYGNYYIIVWTDKTNPYTSIHYNSLDKENNNCILSSFNIKKSEELARLLLNKLMIENLGKSLTF